MQKDYAHSEGRNCGNGIRTLTRPELVEEIYSSKDGKCWDVKNHDRHESIFSHRFDMILKTTPYQLKALVQTEFHRMLLREFSLVAQAFVKDDVNGHLSGTRFDLSYPIQTMFAGGDQFTVIHQVSEPIFLCDDQGDCFFSSINSYEIVGSHLLGHYYHTAPAIKKLGILLDKETKSLIKEAAPQISVSLPFTEREWDVLEELGKGHGAKLIRANLGIGQGTWDDHLENIRIKYRHLGLGGSPVEFAQILRELMVY